MKNKNYVDFLGIVIDPGTVLDKTAKSGKEYKMR